LERLADKVKEEAPMSAATNKILENFISKKTAPHKFLGIIGAFTTNKIEVNQL